MPLLLVTVIAVVGVYLMGRKRTAIAYRNGEPYPIEVDDIDSGACLRSDAASRYREMQRAALRDGVSILCSGKRSGFRTFEDQAEIYRVKGAYGNGGLAAPPGFSNHQGGVAIDISGVDPANNGDPLRREWLLANGPRFGFYPVGDTFQTTREPWHWEYRPT